MAQKIYYDSVNNKEVVDVSGVKEEALVVAEFSLDSSYQTITLEEGETSYVENDTLKKKTKAENDAEKDAAKAAKDADKADKKEKSKTKLGLNENEWNDLVDALA